MTIDHKTELSMFLNPVRSAAELKDWVYAFFDVDLPMGHIDPDSNSSPVEAMYEAYEAYRDDLCPKIPGYIWLSSRDSGKTLAGSILNVVLMIHFKAQVAHMAATKKQAEKSIEYTNQMIGKVRHLLEAAGRSVTSESKYKINIKNEDHSDSFIDIVTANLAGGNSQHCPVASWDEIDTLSPAGLVGYKESKLIPTRYKGKGPLRVKYSTRKFAFGIFEKEIQAASKSGEKVLRWNFIDITEKCQPARHKPEEPKAMRYVHKDLPLSNISEKEYEELLEEKKDGYQKIEAYAGCASCALLPVCKTRLAHRPDTDVGGLYKDIDFTIGQFNQISPDMAEAQLMCWKPASIGLIYKRFDETEVKGNTLTIAQAYAQLMGEQMDHVKPTLKDLTNAMLAKGIKFRVGLDWGFRHFFVLEVSARMPNGDWWIVDCYAIAELELEDKVKYGLLVRDGHGKPKYYPDGSDPASIKTFRRKGMSMVGFKKDVSAGIEAVRANVIDGQGRRRLKVIKHERTNVVLDMFRMHHFKLDPSGNPTTEPDDEEFADVGDALRYDAQNLGRKGGIISPPQDPPRNVLDPLKKERFQTWEEQMRSNLHQLAHQEVTESKGASEGRSIIWDFSQALTIDEE